MPKEKTLGQIAWEAYWRQPYAENWKESDWGYHDWNRVAATIEREVKRRMKKNKTKPRAKS